MFNRYQDILTVLDVTEVLFIGKNRVNELLKKGELRGFRRERVWKIPKKSVEEYVIEHSGLKC